MSLKDDINAVKQELSSDEKLLEQAFHLEKFFKKNKKIIIASAILLIGAFIGYKVYNYLQYSKLEAANSALLVLDKEPTNKEALAKLKENNPKLYTLYSYSQAANSGNAKAIEAIKSNDEFLSDVIKYHAGVASKKPTDSEYYKNLSQIEKAYELIKAGKKAEAKNILVTIPKNSAVAGVARLLEHFTIEPSE